MRIKAGGPGSNKARVFLDGVERNLVIEADEEGRFIVRYCTDEHGKTIRGTDALKTERLVGDVRIEFDR